MNEAEFLAIYQELLDENPFAVRAALRILDVCFTAEVPTLAVTCGARPRLLVNLGFIRAHCHTDAHVKAVITHEFLHVLLRHTEAKGPMTRARHIAFDAVINAIIHREMGSDWSSMMAAYYADAAGLQKLLRPMNAREREVVFTLRYPGSHGDKVPAWARAWAALYQARVMADDIAELAEELARSAPEASHDVFTLSPSATDGISDLLGNHDDLGQAVSAELAAALEEAMREMNGQGIWRSERPGLGGNPIAALIDASQSPIKAWEAAVLRVLKRHLTPDRRSRRHEQSATEYSAPMLSANDRRAFLRSLWDPILPQARWPGTERKQGGTAQIYLDVSGSMDAEMPYLIALLARVSGHVRRPFWAFSNEVVPARITNGRLETRTTGGTSMSAVLKHVIETKPRSAVVVTDGFIETLNRKVVQEALRSTKIHVLVSCAGSPSALRHAGLPYTQLERLPS